MAIQIDSYRHFIGFLVTCLNEFIFWGNYWNINLVSIKKIYVYIILNHLELLFNVFCPIAYTHVYYKSNVSIRKVNIDQNCQFRLLPSSSY